MKRIGIFAFYDQSGKVKGYVKYLLKEIRSFLSYLIIVCNGEISDDGKNYFESCSDCLLLRENKGYDAGAYKDVILQEIGFSRLKDYDELLLFNNTFYGPVYPFSELFDTMQSRKADFWGITARDAGTLPFHIQSYFILVTKRIMTNVCFEEYWKTQKDISSYKDAVYNFELRFTQFFVHYGYHADAYIDMKSLRKNYGVAGNLLSKIGYEITKDYRCPIIKRKHVIVKETEALQQSNFDLIKFIKEKTNYDTDYIWEDLIDLYSPYDLTTYRYLHAIVKTEISKVNIHTYLEEKYFVIFSQKYINYVTYIKTCLSNYKILVVLEGTAEEYQSENIIFVRRNTQTFGEILEQFIQDFRNDSYLCVLTDPIDADGVRLERYTEDICRKMLASENYVEQIFDRFHQQNRLGMLLPEQYFDFESLKALGTSNVLTDEMHKLIEKFDWSKNSKKGEILLQNTNCFWGRTSIIRRYLLTGNIENILKENLFTILPYWIRHEGYYTGILDNMDDMCKEISLKTHILEQLLMRVNKQIGLYNLEEEYDNLFKNGVMEFVRKYKGIYIYGAGQYAKIYVNLLRRNGIKILGIVVSPDQAGGKFMSYDVCDVKNLDIQEGEGIVVAMASGYQKEISGFLEKFPQEDIFFV